jgi:hypothetical protein
MADEHQPTWWTWVILSPDTDGELNVMGATGAHKDRDRAEDAASSALRTAPPESIAVLKDVTMGLMMPERHLAHTAAIGWLSGGNLVWRPSPMREAIWS